MNVALKNYLLKNQMKYLVVAFLLHITVSASAAGTIGRCKLYCDEIRNEALAEESITCQAPNLKLFAACVGGREKAFDQSCIPLCAKAVVSITSYDGCRVITRTKGSHFVSWCGKVRIVVLYIRVAIHNLHVAIYFALNLSRSMMRCCKLSKLP